MEREILELVDMGGLLFVPTWKGKELQVPPNSKLALVHVCTRGLMRSSS